MNILILGATGFIGNGVFLSLVSTHNVTIASRKPIDGYSKWKKVDFLQDNNWDDLLKNIDMVINCIGIIEGDFKKVQSLSPINLYKTCVKKNVKIIHVSAIGAEVENPISEFLKSKKMTDDYLIKNNNATVIYPGIVLGNNGKSVQFFAEIASLPILPLMKMDNLPFVHINQLTVLINDIVMDFSNYSKQIFAFGKIESLKNILESIKGNSIKTIAVPNFVFKFLFLIFPKLSIGIFNKTTFDLSAQDLVANHKPIFKEVSKSIQVNSIQKSNAIFNFIVLIGVSFIWIWSGISSLISWGISMDLMKDLTTNHQIGKAAIYLGSIIDIILGITLFYKKRRKPTLIVQLVMIFGYTILLSLFSPYLWLHPFGVLTKNVALILLSFYLLNRKT